MILFEWAKVQLLSQKTRIPANNSSQNQQVANGLMLFIYKSGPSIYNELHGRT